MLKPARENGHNLASVLFLKQLLRRKEDGRCRYAIFEIKTQLYFHSPSGLRKLIVLNRRTNRKQTGKRQDSFEGSKRCCNSERKSSTRANWKGFATMYRNRGSKKETLEKYVCWKCLMFLCANECCSFHSWSTTGWLLVHYWPVHCLFSLENHVVDCSTVELDSFVARTN